MNGPDDVAAWFDSGDPNAARHCSVEPVTRPNNLEGSAAKCRPRNSSVFGDGIDLLVRGPELAGGVVQRAELAVLRCSRGCHLGHGLFERRR